MIDDEEEDQGHQRQPFEAITDGRLKVVSALGLEAAFIQVWIMLVADCSQQGRMEFHPPSPKQNRP